jgi:hypothetical protein
LSAPQRVVLILNNRTASWCFYTLSSDHMTYPVTIVVSEALALSVSMSRILGEYTTGRERSIQESFTQCVLVTCRPFRQTSGLIIFGTENFE